MIFKHSFENDEPQSCEYKSCQDDINGLHHYWITLNKNFCLDIWLCSKHAELFEKHHEIEEA